MKLKPFDHSGSSVGQAGEVSSNRYSGHTRLYFSALGVFWEGESKNEKYHSPKLPLLAEFLHLGSFEAC